MHVCMRVRMLLRVVIVDVVVSLSPSLSLQLSMLSVQEQVGERDEACSVKSHDKRERRSSVYTRPTTK